VLVELLLAPRQLTLAIVTAQTEQRQWLSPKMAALYAGPPYRLADAESMPPAPAPYLGQHPDG
jgi:hypothetical protein